MGEMQGLEGLMESYDTYKSLLARLVTDLRTFNESGGKTIFREESTALEMASAAFLIGIMPKKETGETPDDVLQCFYFISAVAAINGFSETPRQLHYLRMRFSQTLDRYNRLVAKSGADQLRSAGYYHSYIVLLKAAGLWDTVNCESNRHFEDCYFNTKTTGNIRNFKYQDHPLIKKVLGEEYFTRA